MKRKSSSGSVNLSYLVIAIVVVVGFLIGWFFLGKGGNTSDIGDLKPTPATYMNKSDTNLREINHIITDGAGLSSWKTYQDVEADYTLKYPEDVRVTESGNGNISVMRVINFNEGQDGEMILGGMSLSYEGDNGLEGIIVQPGMVIQDIRFNGYPAKRLVDSNLYYTENIYVADPDNRRVVHISIDTSGDAGYEESSYKLFYKIASTIMFNR